jgi:diaminopropionate ammonia-lyase
LEEETIMAGLSCGEVSLLAWEILDAGMAHVVALPDEGVGPAMRLLASGEASGERIVLGESGVPGLLGLLAGAASAEARDALGLDETSRVLLIGCEGATDPEIYERIVGEAP